MPTLPETPWSGPSLPGTPHASGHTGQRGTSAAGATGPAPVGREHGLCGGFTAQPSPCPALAEAGGEGVSGQRTAKGSLLLPEQFVRSNGGVCCNSPRCAFSRRIFRTRWAIRFRADGLLCSRHLTREPLALMQHCPGTSLAMCSSLHMGVTAEVPRQIATRDMPWTRYEFLCPGELSWFDVKKPKIEYTCFRLLKISVLLKKPASSLSYRKE